MPRYVIASINSYRKADEYAEWTDGMLSAFLHGGEFESTLQDAEDLLMSMRSIGRVTVELTGDDNVVAECGCKLAPFYSPVEAELECALGRGPDPVNPSVYVTPLAAAQFHEGDQFVIGELSLVEVMPEGTLHEIKRLKLRNSNSTEEIHEIDTILARPDN